MNTLQSDLSQFIGTEHWWRHPLVAGMTYTDGVRYFADKAKAWWFVDDTIIEFAGKQRMSGFLAITLKVENEKATITITNGDGEVNATKQVDYTDCPAGEYKFFFTGDVLMLTSEY